jgi:diaminopimelate decarboxylase
VVLHIEGVSAERIAGAVGTPTYVYSASEIRRRFRALDRAFSPRRRLVCYALKANPSLAVCRLLAREGAGAEVVSGGELRRALLAGFPPGKIVFSGVGKTEEEMALGIRRGILAFNIESTEEAEALASVARRSGRAAPYAVRLNPDVEAHTHAHLTTGRARTKFGVTRREALSIYRRSLPGLTPVGVHCHIGSQITELGPNRRALDAMLRVVRELAASGIRLSHIDVGGGMGIRYGGREPFTPAEFASSLEPLLAKTPGLRLLLEPGRSLVGPAGVLLCRVLYRKRAGGRRFVIVDAAMNDLLRPALYDARHGLAAVRRRPGPVRSLDVAGPVCESADTLARGVRLPEPEAGDLLAVLQSGAYGFSMSSQYNSRPRAAEVLVEGRRFRIARRREGFADLVRGER